MKLTALLLLSLSLFAQQSNAPTKREIKAVGIEVLKWAYVCGRAQGMMDALGAIYGKSDDRYLDTKAEWDRAGCADVKRVVME